mmetsp:Transcript_99801/g.177061  ORF Transcript_99801/g.177061 Transcript_99801/m.177061 type:complete len:228 (+) Transcript_99801:97-780(+)
MNFVERASSFSLPELSWSSGAAAASRAAEEATSMLPMSISSSLGLQTRSQSADADAEAATGESDWTIAGAPCSLCASLSLKERMIGFAICWAVGVLLEYAAFAHWHHVLGGSPERFAILYTLGNVLNLSATFFLVGPQRQFQAMFKPARRSAAIVYLLCMILTLVSVAIRWRDWNLQFTGAIVTFTLVALQTCAIFWYGLTYIPFGRSLFMRGVRWLRGWCFDAAST